jgi:predicted ATPase
LGLHPYAINVVAGLLRGAAAHVQVLLATQSVSLIDQFSPEEVVIVERRGPASTFQRLEGEPLRERCMVHDDGRPVWPCSPR